MNQTNPPQDSRPTVEVAPASRESVQAVYEQECAAGLPIEPNESLPVQKIPRPASGSGRAPGLPK